MVVRSATGQIAMFFAFRGMLFVLARIPDVKWKQACWCVWRAGELGDHNVE